MTFNMVLINLNTDGLPYSMHVSPGKFIYHAFNSLHFKNPWWDRKQINFPCNIKLLSIQYLIDLHINMNLSLHCTRMPFQVHPYDLN